MLEMDKAAIGATRPPQLSEMFSKLAMAVKSKTYEFFAEDETDAALESDASDGFSLLDSAEDFITDQKVVVIKPDRPLNAKTPTPGSPRGSARNSVPEPGSERWKRTQVRKLDARVAHSLVSSIFAGVSSFEASYLQLQAAHAPFVEENVKTADRALVSHLQRLSDLKHFYRDYRRSSDSCSDWPIGSCWVAEVEENQCKLRALETVSNRLQAEIDDKVAEVSLLRDQLTEIQNSNSKLSQNLSGNSNPPPDILLSVRVFDSVFRDVCRATHRFSKILIELMKRAGWDLDLAANSVHPDIEYSKKGHNRYALLSYISLGMFRGFDLVEFGLDGCEIPCDGQSLTSDRSKNPRKELIEHVCSNAMELLSRDRSCPFSRFCDKKYQELIHPDMESSIFRNLEQSEVILSSWRSLSVFYESFVNMASSLWTLHKLAFSFDPVVEIFQVERGADFSIVYMEDVTKSCKFPRRTRAKLGFTVFPGFKVGGIVLQSQVYLNGIKCIK